MASEGERELRYDTFLSFCGENLTDKIEPGDFFDRTRSEMQDKKTGLFELTDQTRHWTALLCGAYFSRRGCVYPASRLPLAATFTQP